MVGFELEVLELVLQEVLREVPREVLRQVLPEVPPQELRPLEVPEVLPELLRVSPEVLGALGLQEEELQLKIQKEMRVEN
jgi:hypothetical protein